VRKQQKSLPLRKVLRYLLLVSGQILPGSLPKAKISERMMGIPDPYTRKSRTLT